MEFGFYHGVACDTYEAQANKQGYTFGDKADIVEIIGYGIALARVYRCLTDSEYEKLLWKFQEKVLLKYLEPLK